MIKQVKSEVHFCKRLEEHVKNFGDKPAIRWKEQQVTYRELDKATDAVADELIGLEIQPSDIVAVEIVRSLHVMVAIIGIWKARAAFVYLDSKAPEERNQFILTDSRCKCTIKFDFIDRILKNMDNICPSDHPVGELTDLGFILFTSGSTGRPKGIMLEHGGISAQNLIANYMGMRPDDVQSMLASFSFMAAIMEGFPLLTIGGTLVMVPQEIRRDLDLLIDCFNKNKVTIGFMPPHLATQFVNSDKKIDTLRILLCGGEPVHNLGKRDYEIICVYGSSETGGPVTFMNIDYKAENYPVGKPYPYMRVYAVNDNGEIAKPGEIGELCAAGPQLSIGYLNREDLTREKFVKNPFSEDPRYARICRTGDMVKIDENGNMFFYGRRDLMVNVKSFRIELEEVEKVMNQFPGIDRSFAKPYKGEDGIDALCGYYLAESDLNEQEIINFLRDNLPHYMVPDRYVHLKEMGLTDNGKADRSSLLHPDEYQND